MSPCVPPQSTCYAAFGTRCCITTQERGITFTYVQSFIYWAALIQNDLHPNECATCAKAKAVDKLNRILWRNKSAKMYKWARYQYDKYRLRQHAVEKEFYHLHRFLRETVDIRTQHYTQRIKSVTQLWKVLCPVGQILITSWFFLIVTLFTLKEKHKRERAFLYHTKTTTVSR